MWRAQIQEQILSNTVYNETVRTLRMSEDLHTCRIQHSCRTWCMASLLGSVCCASSEQRAEETSNFSTFLKNCQVSRTLGNHPYSWAPVFSNQ